MIRYVFYCKSSQQEAFSLVESVVYSYMLHEESKPGIAPTYLRSFVSSLAFCHSVMGLVGAKSIVESKRITGLAYKMYLTKRKTASRSPFKISEVRILESVLAGAHNRSWADRHAAGCFLFMIYARARFSDMMNVSSLSLEAHEIAGERFGYVEAEVTRSKTSYSLERRVRLLPMSATIKGISSFFWADEWVVVMEKAGIKVGPGKPLLPGRTPDGWHTLPLAAEAGTHWLRTLLLLDPSFEKERWPQLGTHSAKSTCLSWMSKWGTSPEVRRLMGYHVGDKCSTMMIYGKDNTSAGLRELDMIIAAIRDEEFRPDFPRACMFRKGLFSAAGGMNLGEDAGRKDDCLSDDDSSSVDSADEDKPDHAELEADQMCDKQHVHEPWGQKPDGSCATWEETAYPWPLARAIAAQVVIQLQDQGIVSHLPSFAEQECTLQAMRASTKIIQPRRNLPPPGARIQTNHPPRFPHPFAISCSFT